MRQNTISNKKVLLVANSSVLGEEAILHGINLCKRMGGSLEVLHLLTAESANLAEKSFKADMTRMNLTKHVGYTQLLGDGDFTKETINYAKNRRNLLCVILCSRGKEAAGKGQRQKKFKEVTQLLSCPVVLYTDRPVYR